MKNKNKNKKIESYYLKRKRIMKTKRTVKKYLAIIFFFLVIPAVVVECHSLKLMSEIENNVSVDPLTYEIRAEQIKERFEDDEKLRKYDDALSRLGEMGRQIKLASIEFGDGVDEQLKLIGLSVGIANAESTLGKHFVIEYDKNCFNWWGIRKVRDDGSYLRCFIDAKAGARTEASLLKRLYIDMGLDTPELIVNKYVGNVWSEYHGAWLNNVNKYY